MEMFGSGGTARQLPERQAAITRPGDSVAPELVILLTHRVHKENGLRFR